MSQVCAESIIRTLPLMRSRMPISRGATGVQCHFPTQLLEDSDFFRSLPGLHMKEIDPTLQMDEELPLSMAAMP